MSTNIDQKKNPHPVGVCITLFFSFQKINEHLSTMVPGGKHAGVFLHCAAHILVRV
jgi:hypothetical protein